MTLNGEFFQRPQSLVFLVLMLIKTTWNINLYKMPLALSCFLSRLHWTLLFWTQGHNYKLYFNLLSPQTLFKNIQLCSSTKWLNQLNLFGSWRSSHMHTPCCLPSSLSVLLLFPLSKIVPSVCILSHASMFLCTYTHSLFALYRKSHLSKYQLSHLDAIILLTSSTLTLTDLNLLIHSVLRGKINQPH